jgi:hypothetical protein
MLGANVAQRHQCGLIQKLNLQPVSHAVDIAKRNIFRMRLALSAGEADMEWVSRFASSYEFYRT